MVVLCNFLTNSHFVPKVHPFCAQNWGSSPQMCASQIFESDFLRGFGGRSPPRHVSSRNKKVKRPIFCERYFWESSFLGVWGPAPQYTCVPFLGVWGPAPNITSRFCAAKITGGLCPTEKEKKDAPNLGVWGLAPKTRQRFCAAKIIGGPKARPLKKERCTFLSPKKEGAPFRSSVFSGDEGLKTPNAQVCCPKCRPKK